VVSFPRFNRFSDRLQNYVILVGFLSIDGIVCMFYLLCSPTDGTVNDSCRHLNHVPRLDNFTARSISLFFGLPGSLLPSGLYLKIIFGLISLNVREEGCGFSVDVKLFNVASVEIIITLLQIIHVNLISLIERESL